MTDDKAAEAARRIVEADAEYTTALRRGDPSDLVAGEFCGSVEAYATTVARAYLAIADQLARIHAASSAWGDPASAAHQAGDGLVVRRVRDLAGMLAEVQAENKRLRAALLDVTAYLAGER